MFTMFRQLMVIKEMTEGYHYFVKQKGGLQFVYTTFD